MSAPDRTLGVLVAMPPGSLSYRYGMDLVRAALGQGILVRLYLLDEAVLNASGEEIARLAEMGARISGCALAARRRGVPLEEPVLWGGLGQLSDVVFGTDRFVGFCC